MNEMKLPYCPRCDQIMSREKVPFNGLECECGMCYTYAYALRKGFVDEVVKGDKKSALKAWHTRNRLGIKVRP